MVWIGPDDIKYKHEILIPKSCGWALGTGKICGVQYIQYNLKIVVPGKNLCSRHDSDEK